MDLICFLCLSLQYCSLAVTYSEMADLLALLYVMSSCLFVTFSYCVLCSGSGVVLDCIDS